MCCSAATPPWHLTRPAMAMDVGVGGRTNDETIRRYRTKAQLESQMIDRREFHESQARKEHVDRRRDTEYGSVIQCTLYSWRNRYKIREGGSGTAGTVQYCDMMVAPLRPDAPLPRRACLCQISRRKRSLAWSRALLPSIHRAYMYLALCSSLASSLNQHITPLDDSKNRTILCLGPLLHAGVLIPAGN